MAIKVFINGRPEDAEAPTTLPELLASVKIRPEVATLAVNKVIVRRDDIDGVALDDGDEVEIMLHLAGGSE
ncbi:MAG: sulfur carrier protein ThiS [Coriobacteriales bacterium]|nr:sulfur carrier protein ThiS [Coriobacteriales bacterium]